MIDQMSGKREMEWGREFKLHRWKCEMIKQQYINNEDDVLIARQ
jgi:hypothetical protein